MKKRTAEGLSEVQFKTWKSKYDAIVDRIIEIEKESNMPFDEKKADELIEYKENYEYNIDADNILKITTPWVLNKDNKYERVVKKYSVIYNTDK